MDAYRRFYQLGLIASQGVAIDGIGGASRRPAPARAAGLERREITAARRPAAARRHRLERLRPRPGRDRQRQGNGARQPALPVGRVGALLRGAAHDPGQDQRQRREPVRRADDQHRPHRQPGLEPHGLDRVPLHPVRAEARPGSPTTYLYDGQPRPDERRDRHRAGQDRRRHAREPQRTLYSSHHGSVLTSILGLPLFPWTPRRRGRWATRTPATSAT